jgi:uncharacterized protein with PIN domain
VRSPSLRGLLSRLRTRSVPESRRCSFCPREAVVFESDVYPRVETRRCLDHPPDDVAPGRCRFCGRAYWPDVFHFDCYEA